ncbi:MAG TPA: hypothetical protein VJK06_01670 [Methyloceanibacter sp.]|nr:hypothetical protein [Methyloceanibacter sp.]
MDVTDPAVLAAKARTIKGATIAWGGDRYFDFEAPETCEITLEDYAYALAFGSPRWRGQTRRYTDGRRVIYSCAEHCVRGARQLLADGFGREHALAFLGHESDEVPLPDMPGPVKPLIPDYKVVARRAGEAIDRRFRITFPDPALIKRYDIRLLVTERRDLLMVPDDEIWDNGGSGQTSTKGFEPFEKRIFPHWHPDDAAREFIGMWRSLGGFEPGKTDA